MPRMRPFFAETRSFTRQVSDLFDFINPSATALWNLRWQVQGFVSVRPDANDGDLSARFTSGSGIRANNLRKVCIDTSWENQLGQFAQMISANLISLYEGWVDGIVEVMNTSNLGKKLQFPSLGTYGRTLDGVGEAVNAMLGTGLSDEMEQSFLPVYRTEPKYSLQHIDALLALYRYHKEKRNSFMHRGGVANGIAEAAWREASSLTRNDIGGKRSPVMSKVEDGKQVACMLEESLQLADVIIRIVRTIDAELSATTVAEDAFIRDWVAFPQHTRRVFPTAEFYRRRKISSCCLKVGYPRPADASHVEKLLKRRGVLHV